MAVFAFSRAAFLPISTGGPSRPPVAKSSVATGRIRSRQPQKVDLFSEKGMDVNKFPSGGATVSAVVSLVVDVAHRRGCGTFGGGSGRPSQMRISPGPGRPVLLRSEWVEIS